VPEADHEDDRQRDDEEQDEPRNARQDEGGTAQPGQPPGSDVGRDGAGRTGGVLVG
jgi:hypothetical protein